MEIGLTVILLILYGFISTEGAPPPQTVENKDASICYSYHRTSDRSSIFRQTSCHGDHDLEVPPDSSIVTSLLNFTPDRHYQGIGDSTEASTVGHSLEVSPIEDSTEDETTQTTTDHASICYSYHKTSDRSSIFRQTSCHGDHDLEVPPDSSIVTSLLNFTPDRHYQGIGDSTEASTVGHSLEVSSIEDSTEDETTQTTTDHCTSGDWKTIGNSSYCLIHRPSVTWNDAYQSCKSISSNSHLACFGSFDESNHVYETFDLSADASIWGDCTAGSIQTTNFTKR
ncbi:uncharacterized protein [Apostichopus japonicus]|uniref:uncharacterized protein n=1 Tax=Stichopus japonicus TaxID=307972 RepID=UPI003AB3FA14